MALCKRIIARLDIKDSNVIKGIRFEGLRIVGSPHDLTIKYCQDGVDEIVILDSVASLYGRNNLHAMIRDAVANISIPVTAGGGITCIAEAAALLTSGADKVAVNTGALRRPELISELSEAFGRQCVVASIQARRTSQGFWEAMMDSGREHSGQDVMYWIDRVHQLGAGEILLTSVDRDGTCSGPDKELQAAAAAQAKIPLVFGGGFATTGQVAAALAEPHISGVCIGAALHRSRMPVTSIKKDLGTNENQLPIRQASNGATNVPDLHHHSLIGKHIGVVDYGMGNQQSLVSAFQRLGAVTVLSSEQDVLSKCGLVALPGVGAFPKGMSELKKRSLDVWLKQWVKDGRPLLGICLGMQMLFESSEEFGLTTGLCLLKGKVQALPAKNASGDALILPHMGWNRLIPGQGWKYDSWTGSINQYFVHSYAVAGVDPDSVIFNCRYGHQSFVAAVQSGRVGGFQFHPERSGSDGAALLSLLCRDLMQ